MLLAFDNFSRLYVLVTSFNPLVVYIYRCKCTRLGKESTTDLINIVSRDGFARFSVARYDTKNINNTFVHVTNVAIQKTAADYDADTGQSHSIRPIFDFNSCVSPRWKDVPPAA